MKELIKRYYVLTKPGIIYGNAVTAIGGFLLAASRHNTTFGLFFSMLVGISLIMASACVFNNYLDKDIDKLMARTKKRALVEGSISTVNALLFAVFLGLFGTFLLIFGTNWLTVAIALVGFFFYVVVYGIAKRLSVHGTLIGSISGAVPPVVGYCAVTNQIDAGTVILFLIVAIWQMPHFYGIAMYRLNDYKIAGIPVLPLKKGMPATKIQSLTYIVLFIIAVSLLTAYGYTGYIYLLVMLALSLNWLRLAVFGFKKYPDAVWGRKIFLFSLVIITAFSILLSLNSFLI